MTTPPPVARDEVANAIEGIMQRRSAIDDPNREQLTDDPAEVRAYLRKYGRYTGGQAVPAWVQRADAKAGLVLNQWLWWEYVDADLFFLDWLERLGVPGREAGAIIGVKTRQGVVDRRDRRRAMLGPHRKPDEGIARAERAEQRSSAGVEDRQQVWLDRHRRAVRVVAETLVAHDALADDEAYEWLLEVKRDLRDGAYTPAAFVQIRFAVEAFQNLDEVNRLPAAHPLSSALRDWQALDAEYRAISATGSSVAEIPPAE